MSCHQSREQRTPVRIPARLKSDAGWGDAQICNVSSRGLMAEHTPPPPLGSYVEICRGSFSVVGRVRWIATDRFGVQAVEDIDLAELTDARGRPASTLKERRRRPRTVELARAPSIAEQAATARRIGKAFEFVILVAAIALGSVTLAGAVASTLAAPLDQVQSALEGAQFP